MLSKVDQQLDMDILDTEQPNNHSSHSSEEQSVKFLQIKGINE